MFCGNPLRAGKVIGVIMRFWIDTEFIETGKTIDLVSIGIVAEDGREYYAVSKEFDPSNADEWVIENVLMKLPPCPVGSFFEDHCQRWRPRYIQLSDPSVSPTDKEQALLWKDRYTIAKEIMSFVSPDDYGKPEIWAYYADYDWVVFCWLWGRMTDLPQGFPMYCRDIKQECDRLGNPPLPAQGKGEHTAIADARWNKEAWSFLKDFGSDR